MTLTEPEREKLARILGMLGSHHDGERANAARAAHQFVAQRRVTWSDVLEPPPAIEQPQFRPPPPRAPTPEWRATARRLLACYEHISEWEHGFLNSILGRQKLSPKQSAVLDKIADRVLGGRR